MYYIRKYWHLGMGLICVIILGVLYLSNNAPLELTESAEIARTELLAAEEETAEIEAEPEIEAVAEPDPEPQIIQVHIAGEVTQPGVFTLPQGARVNDLLELAGGATEYADLMRVNLAAVLFDAQQVIIPVIGDEHEEESGIADSAGTAAGAFPAEAADSGIADSRININTATQQELMTLPGVGQVISGNIIAHRETNGAFATVEELTSVPRIGAVTMENLRPLVRVD